MARPKTGRNSTVLQARLRTDDQKPDQKAAIAIWNKHREKGIPAATLMAAALLLLDGQNISALLKTEDDADKLTAIHQEISSLKNYLSGMLLNLRQIDPEGLRAFANAVDAEPAPEHIPWTDDQQRADDAASADQPPSPQPAENMELPANFIKNTVKAGKKTYQQLRDSGEIS